MSWEMVDEGGDGEPSTSPRWREPSNCREYVSVHHRLGLATGRPPARRRLRLRPGPRAGARSRGRVCAGIDASPRLVAVAQDRNPDSDIRVGDMEALPWDDGTFDVVTSFRGIWGTTPQAVDEAHRVLVPGGRLAITVWGNVGKSPGAG